MTMKTSLKTILATATVLSSAWAVPAMAQDAEEDAPVAGNEIIVTATRIEQRLQDVPISITVLDESKITNNNIQSAKDIATYTPGLTTTDGERSRSRRSAETTYPTAPPPSRSAEVSPVGMFHIASTYCLP